MNIATQASVGLLLAWLTWKLANRFVFKSPLDVLQGPPSTSFFTGNIPQIFNLNAWGYNQDLLDRYGRAFRLMAMKERILFTFDPKALHHILVKDQHVYEEAAAVISRNLVYVGQGLVSTLVPIFYEVTERLRASLKRKTQNGPQVVDIMQWMTRTALELIGQSGLGYSFDSLESDEMSHPYAISIKRFSELIGGPLGFFCNQFVYPLALKFDCPRIKRFLVDYTPIQRVQELKEVMDVMNQTSLDIINAKRDAFSSSDPRVRTEMLEKKDIISIIMKANARAEEEDRLTDEEVFGQVSTFVFAAQDTTSSAMCRILHLLCMHQGVQEKLRTEISEAQRDGQLSYDQLVSLPYLDAICRETLRLYPPLNFAGLRTARKDMILPLSKPIIGANGKEVTEVVIPNGTNIILSILGSNTNPDIWGNDAHEWKPERWLSPLPDAVVDARMPGIYSHLLTFLGGGRACIGFKFSQLEMKVVLSVLISTFRFELPEDREITWKMTGIVKPYVGSEPQMPLTFPHINITDVGPSVTKQRRNIDSMPSFANLESMTARTPDARCQNSKSHSLEFSRFPNAIDDSFHSFPIPLGIPRVFGHLEALQTFSAKVTAGYSSWSTIPFTSLRKYPTAIKSGWKYHRAVLDHYGPVTRITGALGERLLLTYNPKALHHILVKDQHVYEESTGFITLVFSLLHPATSWLSGDPTIDATRFMWEKAFFQLWLRSTLRSKVRDSSQEVDVLEWMSRTALELIGQSGMGYSFDDLVGENPTHPYLNSMKKLVGPFGFFSNQFIFPLAAKFNFPRVKRFIVEHAPWKRVQDIREMVNIMHSTSIDIIQMKKNATNSSATLARVLDLLSTHQEIHGLDYATKYVKPKRTDSCLMISLCLYHF
ncbi:hypothetical protein NP233_g7436 [Leucocoprinus birnbaumii]|uniref:Cytochrome P450 n=1 Tax=Leucocoprinus birnbaumii TaxID=56174 RepID=A0AAD5YPZ7_9AGAR|nr:hypothetical protein NP233_g7436 [Leucocoprinus birnbaumii]